MECGSQEDVMKYGEYDPSAALEARIAERSRDMSGADPLLEFCEEMRHVMRYINDEKVVLLGFAENNELVARSATEFRRRLHVACRRGAR